jgi:hypothetical protein
MMYSDSAAGWVIWVQFAAEARNLSLFLNIQPAVGPTQPRIHWMPRAKQPGLYAYHCSPCDAEMKSAWKYCLLLLMLYPFNAERLIKTLRSEPFKN